MFLGCFFIILNKLSNQHYPSEAQEITEKGLSYRFAAEYALPSLIMRTGKKIAGTVSYLSNKYNWYRFSRNARSLPK